MKTSIEISRGTTLNIGSFQTVKPNITVRVDDIPMEQVEEKSQIIQNIVDNLWALEVMAVGDEIQTIGDVGFQTYIKELEMKKELILEDNIKLWQTLQKR